MANEEIEKRETRVYQPDVDIFETKEGMVLIADMAGVDESTVDITLEKDRLAIHGRIQEGDPGGYRPAYSQYGVGDYRRVFALTDDIDRNSIQATVKNGILKLILPKAEEVKPKKIGVTAG